MLRRIVGQAAAATTAAAFGVSFLVPRQPIYLSNERQPDSSLGKRLVKTRFKKGDWWLWQYSDGTGQPYSWERYHVSHTSGDGEVFIDMASKLRESDEFETTHRMHVSLADALGQAQWALRRFGFKREGKWFEAPYRDNVQARSASRAADSSTLERLPPWLRRVRERRSSRRSLTFPS